MVHPDKNKGDEKAAEAFKKLQNAYEVSYDVSPKSDNQKGQFLPKTFCMIIMTSSGFDGFLKAKSI